jgi:hypothetical protein
MITRDLVSSVPVIDFLENARKHGHEIYSVIVAYQNSADSKVVDDISKLARLELVPVNCESDMCRKLAAIGISDRAIKSLLRCDADPASPVSDLIPYGKKRNNVILKAIETGVDVLIFTDTDVYPYLIVRDGGNVAMADVDFVGRHLEYLDDEKVAMTTSDYSGYYIIPPMKFDGMEDLFKGIQKESAYEYIQGSYNHNCLAFDSFNGRKPFKTNKILGGNVAMKIDVFKGIMPFFSTTYEFDGREYLARGEDTLLGLEIENSVSFDCIDIDTRIFHDTYNSYPKVPDILEDDRIRDRFFYACMGWIGRNPFLNWISGKNVDEMRRMQKDALLRSARLAADYFKDERFMMLPEALDASYDSLPDVIEKYREFADAWNEIQKNWDKWRCLSQ